MKCEEVDHLFRGLGALVDWLPSLGARAMRSGSTWFEGDVGLGFDRVLTIERISLGRLLPTIWS